MLFLQDRSLSKLDLAYQLRNDGRRQSSETHSHVVYLGFTRDKFECSRNYVKLCFSSVVEN